MTTDIDLEVFRRLLLGGSLDEHLTTVIKETQDRACQVRNMKKASDFIVGDRVIVNDYAGTKYMHGMTGTVAGFKGRKNVLVDFDHPRGRFVVNPHTGTVRGVMDAAIIDKDDNMGR